ncbi:MAG: 3-keto-disaccharide hydrolase [Steroidobacteraceae bacterium]
MKTLPILVAALAFGTALAGEPAKVPEWRSLSGSDAGEFWQGWKSKKFPGGWRIDGDTLSKEGEVEDLVSRDSFGNFELQFEWQLSEGGNAGIFYRGTREYDYIYWSAPEYQLLDDARHPDGRNRLTSAAAAYALHAAPAGIVKPAGEWNLARIVVDGAQVEHWLNGRKVVTYELWSPDWKSKVAASKFAPYPNYGLAKQGLIGIQGDHAGSLTLRGMRIRELR